MIKGMSGPAMMSSVTLLESNNIFSDDQMKQLFNGINNSDINDLREKIRVKFKEIKKELLFGNIDEKEFYTQFTAYVKELVVEYEEIGSPKKYNKIKKILNIMPNTAEYKEDLDIVTEIKSEYVLTKRLPKSSMLYLNKLYKEIMEKTNDEEEKKQLANEQIERLKKEIEYYVKQKT